MARTIDEFTRKNGVVTHRVRFRLNGRQTTETFTDLRQAERFSSLIDLVGAQAALDQIYAEDQDDAIPTLDEYAEKHIASLTRITDGTRTSYRRIFKRTWSEPLGGFQVNQIDRHMISAVINEMVAGEKSDKTIANAHGLLAGIFNGAVIDGHIAASPSRGVKLPRNTDHDVTEHRYLTRAEFAVLRACMDERFRPLLDVLVGTGIRWGEAEALQVGDVDPKAGTLRVTRAAKWNGSKATREIGPTKTKKGRRTINLDRFVLASLLPLLADKKRTDLVFSMPNGGQLRHATFHDRYWTPAIKKAGLMDPRLRIHDCRHTFASWQLAANIPIYVVQARLGHESIQTTVDTYGHLLTDSQKGAVEVMAEAFAEVELMARAAIPASTPDHPDEQGAVEGMHALPGADGRT